MGDGIAGISVGNAMEEKSHALEGLEFDLRNEAAPGGPYVYISKDATFGRLQLTISNRSDTTVKLTSKSRITLDLTDVLDEAAEVALQETVEGWTSAQDQCCVTLTPTESIAIERSQSIAVELVGIFAAGARISLPRIIKIAYASVENVKDGTDELSIYVSAPPQFGRRLPLKCSLASRTEYGFRDDGKKILVTPPGDGPLIKNRLVLVLERSTFSEPVPLRDSEPSFIVSFITGNDPKDSGALCPADDLLGGKIEERLNQIQGDKKRRWRLGKKKQGQDAIFELKPTKDGGDLFGGGAPLLFAFDGIVTRFAPGYTVMYVHSTGVPDFDDGYFALPFEKMNAFKLTLGKLVNGELLNEKEFLETTCVDWGEIFVGWECYTEPQRCRLLAEDPDASTISFKEIFNSPTDTLKGQVSYTPPKKLSKPIKFKFFAEGSPCAEQHFQLKFKPVVNSFAPTSGDICGGDVLTLKWDCSGGVNCSISGDTVQSGLDLVGSIDLPMPDIASKKTYTYTLTCNGGEGMDDSLPSVREIVVYPVTIDTFTSQLRTQDDRSFAMLLSWTTTNADHVRLGIHRNGPNGGQFSGGEADPSGVLRPYELGNLNQQGMADDEFPQVASWTLSAMRRGTVRGPSRTIEFDTTIQVNHLTFKVNGNPVKIIQTLPWGPVTFAWQLGVPATNHRLFCDNEPVVLSLTDVERGQVIHTPPSDKTTVFYRFEADCTPPVRCAFALRLTPFIAKFEASADYVVAEDVLRLNWECGGGGARLDLESNEPGVGGGWRSWSDMSSFTPRFVAGPVAGIGAIDFPVPPRSHGGYDGNPVAYRFTLRCGRYGEQQRVIELPVRSLRLDVRADQVVKTEFIESRQSSRTRFIAQLSWTAAEADAVWLILHSEVIDTWPNPIVGKTAKTMRVAAKGKAWVELQDDGPSQILYYAGCTIIAIRGSQVVRGPLCRFSWTEPQHRDPSRYSDRSWVRPTIEDLRVVILPAADSWVADVSWRTADAESVHLITTKIFDGEGGADWNPNRPYVRRDQDEIFDTYERRQQREREERERLERTHERETRERELGGRRRGFDGESHDVPSVGSMRIRLGNPLDPGKADDRIPESDIANAFPSCNGCTLVAVNGDGIVKRYVSFEPYLEAQKLLQLRPSHEADIRTGSDA